ncbi:hypothetical protein BC940DRAFT_331354 [Gongronella butleri]|nr:hypothetical protein BC940DRAFT_331354 [Gongronella butleri]
MKNPLHPLGQLRHLTLQKTNLALSLFHGLLAATPQLQELMLLDVHLFTTLPSNARDAEAIAGANLSHMAVNATRVQSLTIEGTYSMESSTFFAFMSQAFRTLRHLYIAILASNIPLPNTHIVSNHVHHTTKDANDLASWLLGLQLTLQSFHFVIQDQYNHTELQWLSDWYWKHHAQHLIEMTLPVSLLLPDSRELTCLALHMDTSVHLHDFVDLCLAGHFSLLRSLALHGQPYQYTRTTSMRLDLYACLSEIPNLHHVELSSMEIHQPPLMNQAPHACLRSLVLRRCTLLGDHALTRLLTFCSQISRLSLDTVALDRAHTLSGLDENKNVPLQVNVDASHIHLDQLYVRDFIARPRGLDTYTRTLKVYERNTPRHADPDILEHATPSWPLSVGYTLGLTLRFHLGSIDHAYFKLRFVDSLF